MDSTITMIQVWIRYQSMLIIYGFLRKARITAWKPHGSPYWYVGCTLLPASWPAMVEFGNVRMKGFLDIRLIQISIYVNIRARIIFPDLHPNSKNNCIRIYLLMYNRLPNKWINESNDHGGQSSKTRLAELTRRDVRLSHRGKLHQIFGTQDPTGSASFKST